MESDLEHAISIQADVTNSNDLKRVVEEANKNFGKIDVLIHTVGSILLKPIHALKKEEFEEIKKV
ncbi:MAG: SDR family oxidoreductase, partial [Candidatus Lokiarchaeota archaeon]|nr:SDR family oxidoreductase [Candidatus Lokiarchaeota archaeon]